MLIVPFAHDQFDNAARIVRMGAGRALPRHRYQSSRVAAELQPLLSSDSYSTTTARLAKIIGVENGLVRTCEAIEQAAAKSSLPARET
jgi:UDP:flavonoid glycosyltransferase YjiC (YdhE family)